MRPICPWQEPQSEDHLAAAFRIARRRREKAASLGSWNTPAFHAMRSVFSGHAKPSCESGVPRPVWRIPLQGSTEHGPIAYFADRA